MDTDVLDGSCLQLSICVFVVSVVLAVITYNPTWTVTFSWGAALGIGSLLWKLFRWLFAIPFKLFGFGSGIVPGKLIVINCILTQVLIEVQDQEREICNPCTEMYPMAQGSLRLKVTGLD